MNPVETYIRDLRDIRSSGQAVKETSFYGALERLLNEIGKTLKPKVRCVHRLVGPWRGSSKVMDSPSAFPGTVPSPAK